MSSVMSRMYVRITPWRSRCAVQPPDAENRTSGGVGGVTGLSRHLHPIVCFGPVTPVTGARGRLVRTTRYRVMRQGVRAKIPQK